MTLERALQLEIMTRLRALGVLAVSIPNSIYFPARTDAERSIIARVIRRMKDDGLITPGAPDLVVFGDGGGACLIELKRPKSKDLLGNKTAAGVLSDNQKDFRDRATKAGIPYFVCHSWPEVESALTQSGVLPGKAVAA